MSFLIDLLPGLLLNLTSGFIIIGFIYYPNQRSRPEYVFTFFVFNILIYFITGLLRDVQLTIGFGFGLLAVFSVLRYRTDRLPVREITFLFVCISLPFINQLFASTRISYVEMAIINLFIIVALFILDRRWGVLYEEERQVLYEKIDLIRPENHELLLADLRERTGLPVKRVEINEINLMRDTARITIYYDPLPRP